MSLTIRAFSLGLYSGVLGEVEATNNSAMENLMLFEARKNRWLSAKGFLVCGADILARDGEDGATAPIIFASHNNADAVSELIDSYPHALKCRDAFGNSVTSWMAYHNNADLVIKLARMDENVLLCQDESNCLPIEHLMNHGNVAAVKELASISKLVLGNNAVIKIAIRKFRDPNMIAELLVAGFREPDDFAEFMAAHRVKKQEVYDIVMSMSQ